MNTLEVQEIFKSEFSEYVYSLSEISEDDTNHIPLCHYKNRFFDFDKIAKKYHHSWSTTDMIFFDLEREYIVFVEYKNGKIRSTDRPKIKQKLLDSFALFYKILDSDKNQFWNFKTYLLFVTNKEKNLGKKIHRDYLSGTDEFLNFLEDNIILYGFARYKPWYFDEIKTPFCDEFEELMKQEFNIILEKENNE